MFEPLCQFRFAQVGGHAFGIGVASDMIHEQIQQLDSFFSVAPDLCRAVDLGDAINRSECELFEFWEKVFLRGEKDGYVN